MKKIINILFIFGILCFIGCSREGYGEPAYSPRKSYLLQADEFGLVEYQLPEHTQGEVPIIQAWKPSNSKFQKVFLHQIPVTLDSSGIVYIEGDPNQTFMVVVIY